MRKLWKNILIASSTGIVLAGVLGAIFGVAEIKHDHTIIFGNFGDYESPLLESRIAKNISTQFKGVNVKYTYYNLNNQLPAMYANNQINIGVPTDYEAAALISMGYLKPLNYSYFNTHGMPLGYYLDGKYVPIENGMLPAMVSLDAINKEYNIPYTLDGDGQKLTQQEAYATEYKYSICNLMTPGAICDISQLYLHCDFNGMQHIDVFDYDLPYFFQNYIFSYTTYGANPAQQKILNILSEPDQSWTKYLSAIDNSNFFDSVNKQPQVGMVTSPQSVYSIAGCLQFPSHNNTAPITNPTPQYSSIAAMRNTFTYFTKYLSAKELGTNPVYNSNSSAGVINEIDDGQIRGGFCYNGDALYQAMGGNFGDTKFVNWNRLTPQTFHILHPKWTMIALDTVGVSKDLPPNLIDAAYHFLYDLCLKGNDTAPTYQGYIDQNASKLNFANSWTYLQSKFDNPTKYPDGPTLMQTIVGDTNTKVHCPFYSWLSSVGGNNDPWNPNTFNANNFIGVNHTMANGNPWYNYGILQNFYFNLYISPWLNIMQMINEPQAGSGGQNWFFNETADGNIPSSQTTSYNNWYEDIYTINPSNYFYTLNNNSYNDITPNTCVELPLSQVQVSNQQIAFNSVIYQDFTGDK